jgi:hypothetical protein
MRLVAAQTCAAQQPYTPLFAAMWAKEILASGNTAAAALVHGVAEPFDSYIDKLLAPTVAENAVH